MESINGRVRKFGDNINTDLIIPSQFLTVNDPRVIIEHAFDGVIKGFSKTVKKGDIIVAGKNFGSGSSREEAVFVVKELGFAAVIAKSFSRIYFRNLVNLGILAITLPKLPDLVTENDEILIDLQKGSVKILKSSSKSNENTTLTFPPLPKFIISIIEGGGALEILKKNIKKQ
jgi:3-isopropylmalate/(R)-2-methylmalate dehydratase small subunit